MALISFTAVFRQLKMRVIVVGAGFSGIGAARTLKEEYGDQVQVRHLLRLSNLKSEGSAPTVYFLQPDAQYCLSA